MWDKCHIRDVYICKKGMIHSRCRICTLDNWGLDTRNSVSEIKTLFFEFFRDICNFVSLDYSEGKGKQDKGGSYKSRADPAPLFLRSIRTCTHILKPAASWANFTLTAKRVLTFWSTGHYPSTFKVTMRRASEKSYEENSIFRKKM